ncbi:MAG: hypothetical protein IKM08_05105, partial [Clostridia bacterium]|nr:hypothetical protein [Clostridia bacterium]
RLLLAKKKWLWKLKIFMATAVLCGQDPYPLFSLIVQGTKRKANKREMPYMGRRPIPRSLLKKRGQNFCRFIF